MKYVDLCGLKASAVGFGTPRLFMFGNGAEQHQAMIRQAFHAGVNYFDVAPAYKSEHNLTVVPRHEILISTKSPRKLGIRQGWAKVPQTLTKQLEASLRALQTDHIDFYFLHSITAGIYRKIDHVIWETLSDFKRQGKVRFIGLSEDQNHDPEHKAALAAGGIIDLLMLTGVPPMLYPPKPIVGMCIDGPVKPEHLKQFTVTLTGTSNPDHLKSNIEVAKGSV